VSEEGSEGVDEPAVVSHPGGSPVGWLNGTTGKPNTRRAGRGEGKYGGDLTQRRVRPGKKKFWGHTNLKG